MFHVHVRNLIKCVSCTNFETELIGLILPLDLFFTRSDFTTDLSGMDFATRKTKFVVDLKSFSWNICVRKCVRSFNLRPTYPFGYSQRRVKLLFDKYFEVERDKMSTRPKWPTESFIRTWRRTLVSLSPLLVLLVQHRKNLITVKFQWLSNSKGIRRTRNLFCFLNSKQRWEQNSTTWIVIKSLKPLMANERERKRVILTSYWVLIIKILWMWIA